MFHEPYVHAYLEDKRRQACHQIGYGQAKYLLNYEAIEPTNLVARFMKWVNHRIKPFKTNQADWQRESQTIPSLRA